MPMPNVNIAAGALRADGATAPRRRLRELSRRAHTSSTAAAGTAPQRVLASYRILSIGGCYFLRVTLYLLLVPT